MQTQINETIYEYQESIFGNKILAHTNLGGGVKVCNEEFVCDERINNVEQLKKVCVDIEKRYD